MNDRMLDEWSDAAGVTFHHGETVRGVSRDDLLQLMRAAQAAERERCAKICEDHARDAWDHEGGALACAAVIREVDAS